MFLFSISWFVKGDYGSSVSYAKSQVAKAQPKRTYEGTLFHYIPRESRDPKALPRDEEALNRITLESREVNRHGAVSGVIENQLKKRDLVEDLSGTAGVEIASATIKNPMRHLSDCREEEVVDPPQYTFHTCTENRTLRRGACIEGVDVRVVPVAKEELRRCTLNFSMRFGRRFWEAGPIARIIKSDTFSYVFDAPFSVNVKNGRVMRKSPRKLKNDTRGCGPYNWQMDGWNGDMQITSAAWSAPATMKASAISYNGGLLKFTPNQFWPNINKSLGYGCDLEHRGVDSLKISMLGPWDWGWVERNISWRRRRYLNPNIHGGFFGTMRIQASIPLKRTERIIEYKVNRSSQNDLKRCEPLEQQVSAGLCSYESRVCIEGPERRHLLGKAHHHEPCWAWKREYICKGENTTTCKKYAEDPRCETWRSECISKVGEYCTKRKVTYRCLVKKKSPPKTRVICGKTPFCMGGDCHDQGHAPNTELKDAVSRLAVLKDLQSRTRSGLYLQGNPKTCTIDTAGFRDCCGMKGGWGTSVGFQKCSADEKSLQQLKKKGLCHEVGGYCKTKVLGVCLTRARSYCCFGSKIVKLIHQQGRPQIGRSWGDVKAPDCSGFRAEDISHLRFQEMRLDEAFSDIAGKLKVEPGSAIGRRVSRHFKGFHPKINKLKRPLRKGIKKPTTSIVDATAERRRVDVRPHGDMKG